MELRGISNIEGKVARVSGERVGRRSSFRSVVTIPILQKFVSIRVDSWLLLLRDCLKRRNGLVGLHPRQSIFEEDRFLRRKWRRIIERRNREINCVRVFAVFEKQMGAATCRERTNPISVRNSARLALCHDQILARHRSPLHIRRTRASPTIDAMTINQRTWPAFHDVSCPAANASTCDLHKISSRILTTNSHE